MRENFCSYHKISFCWLYHLVLCLSLLPNLMLPCVASVSVGLWSEERQRKGCFSHAKNRAQPKKDRFSFHFSRAPIFQVGKKLFFLLTETLAMQAKPNVCLLLYGGYL